MVAVFILSSFICAFLLKGTVDTGATAVALTNSMSLLAKVQITCRQSAEVENHFTAVERLAQLAHSIPPEEPCQVPPEEPCQVPLPPEKNWPSHGHVRFDALTMRYRPGLPAILEDLS